MQKIILYIVVILVLSAVVFTGGLFTGLSFNRAADREYEDRLAAYEATIEELRNTNQRITELNLALRERLRVRQERLTRAKQLIREGAAEISSALDTISRIEYTIQLLTEALKQVGVIE